MEPPKPEDLEFWKWIFVTVVGAISGAFTSAMVVSRIIFKLDTVITDVAGVKRILFKDSGGLNLMTEARHTEICVPHTAMMEQDIEQVKDNIQGLKEQLSDINSKLDIVLNTAHHAQTHTAELKSMNRLMAEISEKLGGHVCRTVHE